MAKTMRDILEEEKVKPLTNVNGTPLVSYEEQTKMAVDGIKEKVVTGIRPTNPDGSIAKSFYTSAVYNEERFFDNRYRVVGDELQIVTAQTTDGYRAISEQKNGRIFAKFIPAISLKRENGKLKFFQNILVSDTDFVSHFTHKLDKEAMKDVLPLIPTGGPTIPEGKLPI